MAAAVSRHLLSILYPLFSLHASPRVRDEDKIDGADQIDETARWIRQPEWTPAQSLDHTLDRQLRRTRDAGVVRPEGMELMRVRGGDERLPKALRHFDRAPVGINEPRPKMAKLDGIETIDPLREFRSDRAA